MKKFILVLLFLVCLVGCAKQENIIDNNCSDTQGCDISEGGTTEVVLNFKDAYESLNGKQTAKGKDYRVLSLSDTTKFEVLDLAELENKTLSDFSGVLFVSDPKCPWCRSIIETAVEVVNSSDVEKVYVVHAWDAEGKEIFRDKWAAQNESYVLEAGHPFYNLLINATGNDLLPDYNITKDDGSSFQTGEKRIYLPSFLYIKDGEIKAFTTGISELQDDGYEELTEEMKLDTEIQLKEFLSKVN